MKVLTGRVSSSIHTVALLSAALLGVLSNWTIQFAYGYSSGLNDHSVLSLHGLQMADPTKFVNDWFMNSAPQPHWLFDLVTYVGVVTNSLSVAYFLYWVTGLIVFGYATAILARRWTPQYPMAATLSVTVIIALLPWNVVGTGSTMIAQALPTVLAGHLVYLGLALLMTERYRALPFVSGAVALVHVQQGAVIAIMMAATAVLRLVVDRRLNWSLLLATAAAVAGTALGLVLRPVAANLSDFVVVCNTIIPYHCAAQTWGIRGLLAFAGIIGLSFLTFLLLERGNRSNWLGTLGLAAFGLLAGMTANALSFPIFGELAQAVNVYRLGVVIVPFAVWGIVTPAIRAVRGDASLAIVGAGGALLAAYFLLDGWSIGNRFLRGAVLIIVVAIPLAVMWLKATRKPSGPSWWPISATAATFAIAAAIAGSFVIRPLNIEYVPVAGLKEWGSQVAEVVPVGSIMLAPPGSHPIRQVTGRATIVDCKNVPYGGDAWTEWRARIADLGGYKQCLDPRLGTFTEFSAVTLDRISEKYGAKYMMLSKSHFADVVVELVRNGWKVVLYPPKDGSVNAVLLVKNSDG